MIVLPGLNGTGPRGLGPMTGGGFGLCSGYFQGMNPSYGYRQPLTVQPQNAYQNYPQMPYGYGNTQSLPYSSGSPYGFRMGRGLGLGWRRGFGPGLGFGRGFGLGWRRGFF